MLSILTNQVVVLSMKIDNLGCHNSLGHPIGLENQVEGESSLRLVLSMNYVEGKLNNPYSNTYNPGWRNHPNLS